MTGELCNMHSLKAQVQEGRYHVDPPAVADAMIRWFSIGAPRRRARRCTAQNECSKPDNGPSASRKTTPG